ncbi:hypothetical protein IHEIED_03970 [Methylorubrum populi]
MSATRVAGAPIDMGETILAQRRLPCICPRQHHGAQASTLAYATHRGLGLVTEQVRCNGCGRTWKRVNAR